MIEKGYEKYQYDHSGPGLCLPTSS
jgi:hypothetical protein